MTGFRWILAGALIACSATEGLAQFFPPPVFGIPVLVPNGIDFQYNSRRLKVSGFIPTGGASAAILPVGPGFGPVFPPQPIYMPGYILPPYSTIPAYGAMSRSVTLQVINPPGVGNSGRVPFVDEFDISGIDLDVEPAAKIWDRNRPAAPEKPRAGEAALVARKAEIEQAVKKAEEELAAKQAEIALANKQADAARRAAEIEIAARKAEAAKLALPPEERKGEAKVVFVPDGDRLADLGRDAFRKGEYGIASLRFRQSAESKPAARTFFLEGQAALAVGKYREAADLIQQGLRRQPDWHASGFRPKVELYGNDENVWRRHKQRLEQAQRQQPKNADCLFLLGYLCWFDGEHDAARAYFRQSRALAADPRWNDLFLQAKAN